MKSLLFYDIECFKCDSLVVFMRPDFSVEAVIWYDPENIKEMDRIGLFLKDHTMAGYNNYYYDDQMISKMSTRAIDGKYPSQEDIKALNDKLISGDGNMTRTKVSFDSIDIFQQISLSKPGLKVVEGNMGKSILESSVPFDIDRPLTEEERKEVERYCRYDVESTIRIYNLRKESYFDIKEELLKMTSNKDIAKKWNTTSVVADILMKGAVKANRNGYVIKSLVEKPDFIPDGAWRVWQKAKEEDIPKDASYTDEFFRTPYWRGCDVSFGFGGLHGAPVKPYENRNYRIVLLDVGSMYPSIIVNGRMLGNATNTYDSIRRERLSIKKSNPLKANALKLVLNSTYGLLKNRYSKLYNPKAASDVCITGQIALFDLCLRLDDMGYNIVNINTDGVAFEDNLYDMGDLWEEVKDEWEAKYHLTLEADFFSRWIQRDVNNYVAVRDDGSIKVKGGDVNLAFSNKYFDNNSCRIIDMAVVYGLLHRNDPDWNGQRSIYKFLYDKADDPMLFQYVLKAGGTFKGVYDLKGNKMQNVNRVFAVKSGHPDATSLRKVRMDDGYVKFPNAPDNMLVWNDDCDKIKDFREWVDMSHYCNLVMDKLKAWEVI